MHFMRTDKRGDRFEYVCTMDGYVFTEDELMALEDYKNSL